ncbi:hypothetical protein COV14_00640 [Candidatus Woesearchaeota archaeon CG10_big_fil_rev_8_21_14_0_10_33_12]|nr:MAG: hypothetical protein COV14_00640 [Candidatus Woesearchaeota archaeon CG10_big_fil_rev_8_21_14_0_10_33_12]
MMKKKNILFLVFFAIVILAAFVLILGKSNGNNIAGYVVMKAGEKPSYDFYFLIAAIILVVAVSTYIYSIRKFGPA